MQEGDQRGEDEQDVEVLAPVQLLDDHAGDGEDGVHDGGLRLIADDFEEDLLEVGLMLLRRGRRRGLRP